ncbi:hypothetical protein F5X68DRAFT_60380 [Plectosphaerella plurivora]|uniref:Zn(2)-C6 fungal-type domain-containing protein n=1 Tax=Plectosphaerella plurivora TaxID=936078 RepID=A0A9P8VJA3_9PEZI|nr:hypothetical protein F5X68DRAFT_60380 [Plectosphaerella plurivora]
MHKESPTPPPQARAILPRPEHMLLQPATRRTVVPLPQPKKTRASRPKVRTGCLTCKERRVKCDERKPACLRCEKAKVTCSGYADPALPRKKKDACLLASRSAGNRHLAPRGSAMCLAAARYGAGSDPETSAAVSIHGARCGPRSFVGLPHMSNQDVLYFDYFRLQVVQELAGHYTAGLWSRLAVGEALQDDCVRHCVLAIGALTQSMSVQPNRLTFKVPSNAHHDAAVRHHQQAIMSFQKHIQGWTTPPSPRSVMVTNTLLVLLETLQGRMKSADNLMNAGLSILKNQISLFCRDPEWIASAVVDDDMRDMEHVLPCLSVMSHFSYQYEPTRRVFQHLSSDPDFYFPRVGIDPIGRLFSNWGRFFTYGMIFSGQAVYACLEGMPIATLVRLLPRQQTFLSHLQTWRTVIAEYAACDDLDAASRRALRLVEIHWLVLRCNASVALDPTEVACDAFVDEYRHLLTLCLDFMRDELTTRSPASLVLGEGLMYPLKMIVYSCRTHDVRVEALEALCLLPWATESEGASDLIEALSGAILLEEQGRNARGWVPPEERWFALGGEWDDERRATEGTRVYWRQCPDEDGNPVFRKLSDDHRQWPNICDVARCTKDHRGIHPAYRMMSGGVEVGA